MTPIRPIALTILALASFGVSGCGDRAGLGHKNVEVVELRRENDELRAKLAGRGEQESTQTLINNGGTQDAEIAALGPDVTRGDRNKEIVFAIESGILFKTGSADLTNQSAETLGRVIGVIKTKYPDHFIRVEGHTDSQPVTRTKDKWTDNWGLSAGRALEVLRFLEKRGLPADNLGMAGYGMVRPVAPNSNDASKQKNRRVEIVAIPKN